MGHLYHGYVSHNQRVFPINIPLNHYKIPLNHYKIPLNHYNIPWNWGPQPQVIQIQILIADRSEVDRSVMRFAAVPWLGDAVLAGWEQRFVQVFVTFYYKLIISQPDKMIQGCTEYIYIYIYTYNIYIYIYLYLYKSIDGYWW